MTNFEVHFTKLLSFTLVGIHAYTNYVPSAQVGQLVINWWFHFLIISFTSFTGILITRQYQYTKRINFLQRMLVNMRTKYYNNIIMRDLLSPPPPPTNR